MKEDNIPGAHGTSLKQAKQRTDDILYVWSSWGGQRTLAHGACEEWASLP